MSRNITATTLIVCDRFAAIPPNRVCVCACANARTHRRADRARTSATSLIYTFETFSACIASAFCTQKSTLVAFLRQLWPPDTTSAHTRTHTEPPEQRHANSAAAESRRTRRTHTGTGEMRTSFTRKRHRICQGIKMIQQNARAWPTLGGFHIPQSGQMNTPCLSSHN